MTKARKLSKLPNYVLSTIAELKLTVGKTQGDKAFAGGYYTDGDGGGGDFYWDTVSIETDNGGTILQVTGVTTGRWKRIYSGGAIDATWFGAVNNSDNTAAIQSALNTGYDVCINVASSTISSSLIIQDQRLFSKGGQNINRTQAIFNVAGNFPAIVNNSGYISFEIEGIYFYYGSTTPTDSGTNSNKIAIYISGTQSGEYYHIINCTVRGAWIGYKDTTGSYLSKLTQIACRHTRQGFWKESGTTIIFDSCSSSDGINGFVVKSVLSATLLNCAADLITVTADSYGSSVNYFHYVYGLNINGWDGEGNIINNVATTINYEVVPAYMRFHNTVGSVSSLAVHHNSLVSSFANSGSSFFFIGDNSVMTFTGCDLFKDSDTLDLIFIGTLSPAYSIRAVNGAKVTVIGCDIKAPTGGTPTTRYSVSAGYTAYITVLNSQYDNTTSDLNLIAYQDTITLLKLSAASSKFSATTNGIVVGETNLIGSGQQYGGFGGEAATFQKDGNVALFSTTSSAGSGNCIEAARGSDGTSIAMFNNGVRVGHIDVSGSATSYVTSSDYRLKQNIEDMVGFIERVKSLKPVKFTWKLDGKKTDGFIAHELQEIIPEAVSGEKDKVDDNGNPDYQGIDQSKIVPLLTRTIQDLIHRVELLEST